MDPVQHFQFVITTIHKLETVKSLYMVDAEEMEIIINPHRIAIMPVDEISLFYDLQTMKIIKKV